MIRGKVVKLLSMTLLTVSFGVIGFSVGVNAEWKQDNTGYWYKQGNSYATGLKNINGRWYFFNSDGYMKTEWNKEGKYKFLTTNSKGEITKIDFDMAKKSILDNDSKYISELKDEYGDIELSEPDVISILDAVNTNGSTYGIKNEECIRFKITKKSNADKECISYYLVSIKNGTIYSISNKSGSEIYEIKDDNIVKSYLDLNLTSEIEWR